MFFGGRCGVPMDRENKSVRSWGGTVHGRNERSVERAQRNCLSI